MKKIKKNLFFEGRFLSQHRSGESSEVGGGAAPERKELWNKMTLDEFIAEGLKQLKHLKTLIDEEGDDAKKADSLISNVATLGFIDVNSPNFNEAATKSRLEQIASDVHAFKIDVLGRIGETFEEEKKEDKKKVFKVTKKEVRDLYKEVREGEEIKETKKIWSAFVVRNYDDITKFLFDDSWNGKEIRKYHTDEWTNKERKEFVKAIQGFINQKFAELGIEGRLKVDGFFGPRTQTALRMYNAGTADKFDELDGTEEVVAQKEKLDEKVQLAKRIESAIRGVPFDLGGVRVLLSSYYGDEYGMVFDYSSYNKTSKKPKGRINLKYLENGNVLVTSVIGQSFVPLEMTSSTLSSRASIREAVIGGFFGGIMKREQAEQSEGEEELLSRDEMLDELTDFYNQIPRFFTADGVSYSLGLNEYKFNEMKGATYLKFDILRKEGDVSKAYDCLIPIDKEGVIGTGVINNVPITEFNLDSVSPASSFWANVAPAIERFINGGEEEVDVEDIEDEEVDVEEKLEAVQNVVSGFPEKFDVNGKEFFIQPGFSPLVEIKGKTYLRLNLEGDFGASDNTRYVTIGYDAEIDEYNVQIGASSFVDVGSEFTLSAFKERVAAFIGVEIEEEDDEDEEVFVEKSPEFIKKQLEDMKNALIAINNEYSFDDVDYVMVDALGINEEKDYVFVKIKRDGFLNKFDFAKFVYNKETGKFDMFVGKKKVDTLIPEEFSNNRFWQKVLEGFDDKEKEEHPNNLQSLKDMRKKLLSFKSTVRGGVEYSQVPYFTHISESPAGVGVLIESGDSQKWFAFVYNEGVFNVYVDNVYLDNVEVDDTLSEKYFWDLVVSKFDQSSKS